MIIDNIFHDISIPINNSIRKHKLSKKQLLLFTSLFLLKGIDFARFTLHVMPGIVICFIASMFLLKVLYRDVSHFQFEEPPELVGNITVRLLKANEYHTESKGALNKNTE